MNSKKKKETMTLNDIKLMVVIE